jgi:hypothetical protein
VPDDPAKGGYRQPPFFLTLRWAVIWSHHLVTTSSSHDVVAVSALMDGACSFIDDGYSYEEFSNVAEPS